jgi:hypothetical protein
MTLIPFSSSAFISTDDSQLHRRFGPKIQACDSLFGNRPQVADAAVGKIDQVTVTVDIASLDEPWLARPLMRRGRLIIERRRDVIDPDVFRFRVMKQRTRASIRKSSATRC